jgi:uncharacterized membrane protein HdeD (DUF308 family)
MGGAFLLVLGVVLALTSIIGVIQNFVLLFAFLGAGNAPTSEWYASVILAAAFIVGAVLSLRIAKHSPPAKHWSISLMGGVLGFVAAGLLKALAYTFVGSL